MVAKQKAHGVAAIKPCHVAIIMDGNGRWAQNQGLPRPAGHREGAKAVQRIVTACRERDIAVLTLFAFSSENWHRPTQEVSFLMELFLRTLRSEIKKLHQNNIRLRIIGDRSRFGEKLRQTMLAAEQLTADNTSLTLTIAANYGGRWDVMQATKNMLKDHPELAQSFSEDELQPYLSMSGIPEPDLFIRTGGEQRISNFMLWQLAYTELYFTDVLWPAFGRKELEDAIASYQKRERRFGRTSEQLTGQNSAGSKNA